MSPSRRRRIYRRALPLAALVLCGPLALVWLSLLAGGAVTPQAAANAPGEPQPQADDSLPASNVTMIGASPDEAPDETWGLGEVQGGTGISPSVLVRYTADGGWQLGGALLDPTGEPIPGFALDHPSGLTAPSPLAGQMTAGGEGVLLGTVPKIGAVSCGAQNVEQVVLVREPGGAFQQTPQPSGEAALESGECMFSTRRAPLLSPLHESSGRAGALVVPVTETGSVESTVLHWDGTGWTREPIEIPAASSGDFHVLGIGSSSPGNAWLLAQLASGSSYPAGAVALFRRQAGEGGSPPRWRPVALTAGPGDEEAHPLTLDGQPFTVHGTGEPPSVQAQLLTVTDQGVWVDGERQDAHVSATMFFRPEGAGGGSVVAGWCDADGCEHELPQALPSGASRSIAWANSDEPFGERVIAGFQEGVTLRLDGSTFTRVLGLGGGVSREPGATYGAAFSNAREGWLGEGQLPVHLTVRPAQSQLAPWPVSFRHTLLAIAPQPGAPQGSLAAAALAVGDEGEVARYEPGKGWMPESLLGTGGGFETPRLRAVAWPTPMRAFAVGDKGAMWMWRGETGLWEQDPAQPLNFRGNLLGIAFDPSNPARGYAVGSGGVLLGYGKTWTQEPLPPEAQGASFTSIAFAGSEAIVAYRKLLDPSRRSSYVGGLLVNSGSGWQVDQQAAAAGGSQSKVPEVVAGLADGGAAFVAESFGAGEAGAQLFTRENGAGSWQAAPTPLPHGSAPGALALFREGGALRAVAAGSAPDGFEVESVASSPPGVPQPLIDPYPLPSSSGVGLVRQTASGWSDEQHELNDIGEPLGKYSFFDTVYQPDPVWALLVDPSSGQGWAVGGAVDNENEGALDTSDVERYREAGAAAPGLGSSPVPTDPTQATFALGGNAQCAAPCADRANARVGPDVWLSAALARAGQISGVRAFLYTGPRVTTGVTNGPATLVVPYAREFGRYAQLLGSSPLPTFAAASTTDLDGAGSECTFAQALGGFPASYGTPVRSGESCTGESGYYELDSSGAAGTVRILVLDTSRDVGQTQREWLIGRLQAAEAAGQPAIVVGNADLSAQIAAGDTSAGEVAGAMIAHNASAYFYDAPEENVQKPLRFGAASMPSFGSGTLGYVKFLAESTGEFLGASGFLLAQVDASAASAGHNRVPVTARLIPSIGELAIEAKDGTLLRRSQAALFDGLARRPRAGNRSPSGAARPDTDPYIPIPSNCVGTKCANGLFPEYTFSSSRPDIGDFVRPNLATSDTHAVLLENEKPIPDPQSGLFCAYNAGTTIVTITSGGLSSSLPVTVQAGSVRRPCGTQPLKEQPVKSQSVSPPAPAPAPAPSPAGPAPAGALSPPLPLPPPPAAPAVPAAHAAAGTFFLPPVISAPVLAFVPPPVPTPARPTPPSGTSAVTSPVEAPEKEEQEEEATESVANKAVAYHASEHEPPPAFIIGIIVLAAFAGASIRRRSRGGRRELNVATATVSTMRTQRQLARRARRW